MRAAGGSSRRSVAAPGGALAWWELLVLDRGRAPGPSLARSGRGVPLRR